VQLDFELENHQLGLQNGKLDPLTIVHGKRNALLYMDTRAASAIPIYDSPESKAAWIVAYSGVSRELTKSGYNVRVEECAQAAALLRDGATILSDAPHTAFEQKKESLPQNLRRRAEHFYGEVDRVHKGVHAWQASNLEWFGQLMNQSCESSIRNYESGSPILIELSELVSNTSGVYGSRFSGGGYGGCVVALAEKDRAEAACQQIAEKFSRGHPELPSQVFVAEMGDEISLLSSLEVTNVES
jgi:galactokinase